MARPSGGGERAGIRADGLAHAGEGVVARRPARQGAGDARAGPRFGRAVGARRRTRRLAVVPARKWRRRRGGIPGIDRRPRRLGQRRHRFLLVAASRRRGPQRGLDRHAAAPRAAIPRAAHPPPRGIAVAGKPPQAICGPRRPALALGQAAGRGRADRVAHADGAPGGGLRFRQASLAADRRFGGALGRQPRCHGRRRRGRRRSAGRRRRLRAERVWRRHQRHALEQRPARLRRGGKRFRRRAASRRQRHAAHHRGSDATGRQPTLRLRCLGKGGLAMATACGRASDRGGRRRDLVHGRAARARRPAFRARRGAGRDPSRRAGRGRWHAALVAAACRARRRTDGGRGPRPAATPLGIVSFFRGGCARLPDRFGRGRGGGSRDPHAAVGVELCGADGARGAGDAVRRAGSGRRAQRRPRLERSARQRRDGRRRLARRRAHCRGRPRDPRRRRIGEAHVPRPCVGRAPVGSPARAVALRGRCRRWPGDRRGP